MASRSRTLRLNRRAIVYGCLTDFGTSIAAVVLLALLAGAASSDPASLQSTSQSPVFVALQFVLGLAATAAGGYMAARLSPRAELTNALGVGVVMTILAVLGAVFVARGQLELLDGLGILLTTPAALIGGLVRLSRLERPAATG